MPTDPRAVTGLVMDAVGTAANAIAIVASIWIGLNLWRMGWDNVAMAGGLPEPSLEYAWALVNAPELHRRLLYWFMAWVCWAFALGFAALAIAGLHWAWHAIRSALR